jgi:gliding motility-associated-like protein
MKVVLQIVGTLTSGASFTLNGFILTINYTGVPFPGTDKVTISICDQTGLCTQQQLSIELSGTITVYNAVSPNGDDKNEILYIQYIDLLPDTKNNQVFIYNRWGDEVWKTENYNNTTQVFKGLSNAGNELSSGTYYYKIVFNDGSKSKTGFLSLKK